MFDQFALNIRKLGAMKWVNIQDLWYYALVRRGGRILLTQLKQDSVDYRNV